MFKILLATGNERILAKTLATKNHVETNPSMFQNCEAIYLRNAHTVIQEDYFPHLWKQLNIFYYDTVLLWTNMSL